MNWKDVSSYSKGDTDRSPRTVQLDVAGLRVVVTRHIYHAPEDWVLNCEPWFSQRKVGDGTLEDAKETALYLVRARLAGAVSALTPNAALTGSPSASPG